MIGITRRGLLGGGALLALGSGFAPPALARPARLVGATYNEQVYFDGTGQTAGWHPPMGAQGLAATADMDEVLFRMAHPYC